MTRFMGFEERVQTVLEGGMPDRVPFIPLVYYFAGEFAGMKGLEFATDMRAYRRAMDACFWEVGPFDAMYPLPVTMDAPEYDITYVAAVGLKPVLPSADSEGPQLIQTPEAETLLDDDIYRRVMAYDLPGKLAPLALFMMDILGRHYGEPVDARLFTKRYLPAVARLGGRWVYEMVRWKRRGIPFFMSFGLEAPFDTISMARGVTGFSVDLHRREDEMREACLKLAASMAFAGRLACLGTGVRRFLLLLHRTSNDFISPQQFERIAYPGIKLIADYLAGFGIAFAMHCDGNWDRNLEVMTTLPENSCFQFDGCTDIFRAREVLGDRYVIMGDVSSTMLAYGTREEVLDYCRRLIEGVGARGRFILSSGCEVPGNAKPENVRAMVEAVKEYGRY